jgi:hypothetical protein
MTISLVLNDYTQGSQPDIGPRLEVWRNPLNRAMVNTFNRTLARRAQVPKEHDLDLWAKEDHELERLSLGYV